MRLQVVERLELLLRDKWVEGPVGVDEDADVGLAGHHVQALVDLLRLVLPLFAQLRHISPHFL